MRRWDFAGWPAIRCRTCFLINSPFAPWRIDFRKRQGRQFVKERAALAGQCTVHRMQLPRTPLEQKAGREPVLL